MFAPLRSVPNLAAQARAAAFQLTKIDVIGNHFDNVVTRKAISRSFIADTITTPTHEMYQYAANASIGDDVYNADTSTNLLEARIAALTGKEAALFCSSGTLSNQLALRTHLQQPPFSILCDERAHINRYEAGGVAWHSGAATIAVSPKNGYHLTRKDVKARVVTGDDVHCAPTRVVALENTLNGVIFPQDEIIAISDFAKSRWMKMHLDGARLWHVTAETGMTMEELCRPFDSVSLCFSKGLGAPVGSILVGNYEFIAKARWFRKAFGGGMRQTGFLAATAAYAVSNHLQLLPQVHELAHRLEQGLKDLGVRILGRTDTSMVFFDPSPVGLSYDEISKRASQLENPITVNKGSRLVVHIQTSPGAVEDFLELIKTLVNEKREAGFLAPAVLEPPPEDMYVRKPYK